MHAHQQLPRVSLGAGMRAALIELSTKRMGCVCVLDADEHLAGIVTDGDVRRLLQEQENVLDKTVNAVMTSHPVTITPDASLHDALLTMEKRDSQINVLPVVDGENICLGVIRLHDILLKVE